MPVPKFLQRLFSRRQQPATAQAGSAGSHRLRVPARLSASAAEAAFCATLFPVSVPDRPLTLPQKLVQDVVRHNLAQPDHQAVPHLPAVIPRLLRSLRDPDSSAADYADIINKDPGMSAAVLKLANSVLFNPGGKPISSIQRAVVGLGIDGMRSVLSAAVMRPVLNQNSPYFAGAGAHLWSHSLQCALIAEMLASRHGAEPYKGYLLGLVHDIGKITVFSELNREYSLNAGDNLPGRAAFAPLIQDMAAGLGKTITSQWQLPAELITALQEQPGPGTAPVDGKSISALGKVLFEANLLGNVLQAEALLPEHTLEHLLQELQLPAKLLPGIRRLGAASAMS